jgi:class I fructose-bisphosphate aldolase
MKKIEEYLGDQAENLLQHRCKTIDKAWLTIPGPSYLDQVFVNTNRSPQVLNALS